MMTVHLDWVICRLASFIITIVMLIAASVLLVWMFSAFHFLRIIFLNFNLIEPPRESWRLNFLRKR